MKPPLFVPAHPVEGPAFSRGAKLVLTAFMVVFLFYTALLWERIMGQAAPLSDGAKILLGATVLLLVYLYSWVLRSRVRIDAEGITQTWIATKHVPWTEVVGARMIAIPRVEFLFPPRLLVKAGFARSRVFNGGTPELWRAFAEIDIHYRRAR